MTLYWADMKIVINCLVREFMKNGLFCASVSGHPFSALPFDQWIEMTMNKGTKMKSGWVGFTKTRVCYTHTQILLKVSFGLIMLPRCLE